ncbi:hypothetical protein D3C75_754930 [compost metagenome]
MRDEQVLIEPARHQLLARAGAIEQRLPLGDLRRLGGIGEHRLAIQPRPLGQPAAQGSVLGIAQPADREGHARTGIAAGEVVELLGRRALVVAVDADIQVIRQPGARHGRMGATQLEHARHQRGIAASQHRMEAAGAPALLRPRIDEQPRGRLRLDALAVVDRYRRGTALGTCSAAEVELAGRVVAGMAGHALLGEDRLHFTGEGHRCSGQRQAEQKAGQQQEENGHGAVRGRQ